MGVDAGPSCTDMRQNGDETDVDCGGSCPKCPTGKRCTAPGDCQGGFCNSNKCGVCASGTKGCSGNSPETCTVDGVWSVSPACASPTPMCSAGQCVTPSCQGAGPGAGVNCGPTNGDNCCDSPYVIGNMYSRSFDGINYTDQSAVATVSDFRMDRYEVTVGRFRAFLAAYPGSRPAAGAGQHPTLGAASGWQAAWDGNLPSSIGMYQGALKCGGFATWTDSPGANEKKPMTCLSWYDAFAFCAWDGGRLPTEAEWNYVAAYGNGACPYPWSTCLPINTTYAVYDCTGDGSIGVSMGGTCTANDILAVGSRSPTGDARWSQSDISGNANEWTLDTYASYIVPCNNCANLTMGMGTKVYRGGNFIGGPHDLLSGTRFQVAPTLRDPGIGVRCVRAP
jgi:formylglycine-generating enzyme required for sulfatase activity